MEDGFWKLGCQRRLFEVYQGRGRVAPQWDQWGVVAVRMERQGHPGSRSRAQ